MDSLVQNHLILNKAEPVKDQRPLERFSLTFGGPLWRPNSL
jgi:hypothetical protein